MIECIVGIYLLLTDIVGDCLCIHSDVLYLIFTLCMAASNICEHNYIYIYTLLL